MNQIILGGTIILVLRLSTINAQNKSITKSKIPTKLEQNTYPFRK
jgi:hypothetical protein